LKFRKSLSNWLTTRYLLVVRNEENLAENKPVAFTYAKVIFLFTLLFFSLFGLSLYLASTVFSQWFDPRHATMEYNQKLLRLTMELDSLEHLAETQNRFIANFKAIVSGNLPDSYFMEEETLRKESDLSVLNRETMIDTLPMIDSKFRSEFEDIEGTMFSYSRTATYGEMDEVFFFPPIQGIISSPYNPKIEHYGVDVVAKTNEPIKSIADGTVIMSTWTQEAGHVLAIQHRSNLISVYKHNSVLLKKVGNFVNAGEVIAIIGNSGEMSTGPHLHFELWYNGNPLNPEDFITF
jgi:murein DD-endopeptidase MepM/ murein hydrolase activator NlpD